MKAMSIFTVFEILRFEVTWVLSLAQWGAGSERVKFSVNNEKNIRLLLKLREK